MKRIFFSCLSWILVTVGLFSMAGCSASKNNVSGKTSALFVRVQATVNGEDLKYGSVYKTSSGRQFRISDFRYYLTRIGATRSDGTQNAPFDSVILISPDLQSSYLRVPVLQGAYKSLQFTIGLDSLKNHGDPTVYALPHPLAIQTPSMHWDWNSGYLFLKLEGLVDTTVQANGPINTEYFYHIGLDTMLRAVDIPIAFSVPSSGACSLDVRCGIDSIIAHIDFLKERSTHTFDNLPLAQRIMDRIINSFAVVNIHPAIQ